MKLSDQQDKHTKRKTKRKKKRNVERLTEKDILELMGVNRDRYERHGGAIRKR